MFMQFYRDMKTRVNFNGSLSETISINKGIKQVSNSSLNFLSMYFYVTLSKSL